MSGTSMKIEALNRDNYDTWRMQIEAILMKSDSLGYVLGKKVKPEKPEELEAWELADGKAKADIILAISPGELKQVKGCETSKEIWDKLKSIYASGGPARKATLLKKLILTRMRSGDVMRYHINDFFDTVDKLENMKIEINPDLLTIILLYSLPEEYDNFRIAIETRDVLPSPHALRVKILEESDARKSHYFVDDGNAFWGKPVRSMRNRANTSGNQRDVGKERGFPFKCHICSEVGHMAKFCPQKQKQKSAFADEGFLVKVEEENNFFQGNSSKHLEDRWCIDSGCSSLMSYQKKNFIELRMDESRNVNLAANKCSTQANGVGRNNK